MIGSPAPLSDIIRSLGYPVPNDFRGKAAQPVWGLRSGNSIDMSARAL